jgi:capsular polysaccharide biosynthesis protein
VQWARTFGSISYGVFSAGIPMVLEMVVNAIGSSWKLMTIVFALIFGLGGSMMSLRCYQAQERIRVNVNDQQESLREKFRNVNVNTDTDANKPF